MSQMMSKKLIAGIDFGSQLAGTTVICREVEDGKVSLFRSKKGESADRFLEEHFKALSPHYIGLDAPLSLPAVYKGIPGYEDYQFRTADRLLRAMSPMFLGGLTARAMRLAGTLFTFDHTVIEVYPAALLKELQIESRYKKNTTECALLLSQIEEAVHYPPPESAATSHDVDAYLAFLSARRSTLGEGVAHGDLIEGVITV